MSKWPEFRSDRASFGMESMGSVAVEVECSDGSVGVSTTLGGEPAAYVIERHLAPFMEGKPLSREGIALAWEQMFKASLHYGRKGIALHAISAMDLGAWDALGRSRQAPIWALLGQRAAKPLPLYATTPRPDVARDLGFIGGKLPLPAGPAEGEAGLNENLAMAQDMRVRCGDPTDFFLAWDCWMALDVPFTLRLAQVCGPLKFRWIEEPLPPDDYWGYAEIKRELRGTNLTATGEHEYTRWGFQLLIDMDCVDILQPDVTSCGGFSELMVIGEMADKRGVQLVPHASSVYAYQYLVTRPNAEFAEFVMYSPDGIEITPMLAPLLVGEPLPYRGVVQLLDTPGFGVELNRKLAWTRPYPH